MNTRKPPMKPKRLVWRISEATPLGEWVDPNVPERRPAIENPPDSTPGTWVSSYDLLEGSSVSEGVDTVPGELVDELFNTRKKGTSGGR
jgi:hypothetical protein